MTLCVVHYNPAAGSVTHYFSKTHVHTVIIESNISFAASLLLIIIPYNNVPSLFSPQDERKCIGETLNATRSEESDDAEEESIQKVLARRLTILNC